ETIVEVEGATGRNIAYKFYYADPSDIDNGVWENNLPSDRSFELFPAGIIQILPDTDFDVALYDYTYIQIIHNSADPAVESVDIYVDGDMAIDEFAFREATVFLPAPTDVELQLTITPAGADPAAGVTVPVTLEEDQKYYAIASGVLNPDNFAASPTSSDIGFRLDLVAGTQLSAASDSLSFKIMHGSTDAPAVDLFVQGLPDPIVSGATFSAITDYITVPAPEVYTIDLYASEFNSYLASYEVDATNLAGGTAFITASGFINPAANQDGEGFAVLAVFADGSTTLLESVTSSIEDGNEFPTAYTLSQNYPNPFNPSTTIQYSLPEVAEVMLEVYNMLGQKVASLVEARQSAGTYTIEFDGSGLASGTYMYRMQAGDFVQTRKFALIK
ncbi:MAG: T9SS type A sorting domain-containing protein, partial [Balneolaceae bacterium]